MSLSLEQLGDVDGTSRISPKRASPSTVRAACFPHLELLIHPGLCEHWLHIDAAGTGSGQAGQGNAYLAKCRTRQG